MNLAAQLILALLLLWVPLALVWGPRRVSLRLGLVLAAAFYANGLWQAYPAAHDTVVGWLVVAVAGLALIRGRGRTGGGRGRGVARGAGGGRGAAIMPRRGGGMVVGPRPFDAGGSPPVVVVAGRGGRAVRGVAGRVGRGRRHLEVVGGTAVGNVAEGRLPWRSRAVVRAGLWAYVQPMAWLERQPWLRNRRAAEELRGDVEGQAGGYAPTWVPGERRPPWRETADQLHRDVDRRRP